MSLQSNKAVIQRFVAEVWNAGNLAAADELVHPDYEIPGVGLGPEAVKRNVTTLRAAFPDLEWTIEQMLAEGDWVAVRLTMRGTHDGHLFGFAPTGKPVTMKEQAFWQVVDGRLRALWAVGDALGLRILLGAIPATAWHQPVGGTGDPT